jgi:hypothetical protein
MGTHLPRAPTHYFSGVAILLVELHALVNIGHAAKDLLFLAHVLHSQHMAQATEHAFEISAIIIDDKAIATGNITHHQAWQYRYQSINALVAGMHPPMPIIVLQQGATYAPSFGQEHWWQGASSVCFGAGVQKAMPYVGDFQSAEFLRQRIYSSCAVDKEDNADQVLIVVHGLSSVAKDTRRWANLDLLVETVTASPFRTAWCKESHCRALPVVTKAMTGLSFCEQVALYARSKVVIVHHGASLANGLWLRPLSVMVELNKQWSSSHSGRLEWSPITFNAGYAAMFASTGVAYLGARVTYGQWPPKRTNNGRPGADGRVIWTDRLPHYDFNNPDMEIAVNQSRFALVLDELNIIVSLLRS